MTYLGVGNADGQAMRATMSVAKKRVSRVSSTETTRRHCIAGVMALTALGLSTVGLSVWGASGSTSMPTAPRQAQRLLVVGDSLSAEYGLARGTGWVALLDEKLRKARWPVTVVNASISGDTTSGGRSRLSALLKQHQPTHVVIELGGNDALRGFPLRTTQDNLTEMTKSAQASGAKVLLVGMQMPPNYGASYARDFAALFGHVAQAQGAALVPFLLAGVADDPDPLRWFQSDRIHPNATAHPRILENVWSVLGPWLSKDGRAAAARP